MMKKLVLAALAFLIALSLVPARRAEALTVTTSYVVNDGVQVSMPLSYEFDRVFYSFTNPDTGQIDYLSSPNDIYINEQGYIFIADTDKNRIVKLDQQGKCYGVFTGPADKPLSGPQGVYADEQGNMYIADTKNYRIVHLSADGSFVEEFLAPVSPLLGQGFVFDPSKIALSKTGYIYVVRGEAIMMLDANDTFRGYLGQVPIPFKFIDVLIRMFASQHQQSLLGKTYAIPYTNIFVDSEGMVYATSNDNSKGEIKRLNSIGKNIYKTGSSFGEPFPDPTGTLIPPKFISITVDKDGIVTALDANSKQMYQFDRDGNAITVFGTPGTFEGQLDVPTAIDVAADGTIFVADRSQNSISAYKPTNFINLVHEATTYYDNGQYEQAKTVYEQVLTQFSGYPLALTGYANSLYKEGQWKAAMDGFLKANNPDGYSKAFNEYRYTLLRQYFFLVIIAAVAAIALLGLIITRVRRVGGKTLDALYYNEKRINIPTQLKMSLAVIFSPRVTFETIKYNRGKLNIIGAVGIYVIAILVRILNIAALHFPLRSIQKYSSSDGIVTKFVKEVLYYPWYTARIISTNIPLEIVKLLLPALTWVVVSYLISSIMDGESKFSEIFTATSFCFVPYIIFGVLLTPFSYLLGKPESGIYVFFACAAWIYSLILFYYSFKTLNGYKPGKAIIGTVVGILSIALIWIVIFLGFMATARIYQFIEGLVIEIQNSMLR